jgi:hypothetical protein
LGLHVFPPGLHKVSPGLHVFPPGLHKVSPGLHVFPPGLHENPKPTNKKEKNNFWKN